MEKRERRQIELPYGLRAVYSVLGDLWKGGFWWTWNIEGTLNGNSTGDKLLEIIPAIADAIGCPLSAIELSTLDGLIDIEINMPVIAANEREFREARLARQKELMERAEAHVRRAEAQAEREREAFFGMQKE